MGKRKRVETKIHTELSEYSSLLRALRTTATLDLASQLTLPDAPGSQPTAAPSEDVYEDDDDLEPDFEANTGAAESSPVEGADAVQHSEEPTASSSQLPSHGHQKKKSGPSATTRDTWTRWPLVPSEVHTPEWPFDEEVRILAQGALRRLRVNEKTETQEDELSVESEDGDENIPDEPSEETGADDASDSDDSFDDILTPVNVHALTRAATNRLYEILAASAAMLPEGEDSMQNRHGYINWELILSAVDAFDLFKPE